MSFVVNVFSPVRVFLKNQEANSLSVPTLRGEINILPDHADLVTELDVGVLKILTKEGAIEILVDSGVCKVKGKNVVILPKEAVKLADFNIQALDSEIEALKFKLNSQELIEESKYSVFLKKMYKAEIKKQCLINRV